MIWLSRSEAATWTETRGEARRRARCQNVWGSLSGSTVQNPPGNKLTLWNENFGLGSWMMWRLQSERLNPFQTCSRTQTHREQQFNCTFILENWAGVTRSSRPEESRAVTGIQLEEKQVNTEFNRSQEKILAWPRLSQCCSGNWTFCWRLECEAGRYCVCCRSRTSGSAPGVEDAQLDRNNLPEGLMTSKKREFLICSGGRVGATSGTLCSTFYRYHVRFCRLDWLEITSPSSVWISGPCCWWFDEQNNTQCKNEEKGSLLIFSCKMLLQTQTHSDRTASLKWLNDLNSLFTFNYSPVRDLNRVLRGSKLNHGAWIMLRFLYQQIYFKKPNEIFLSLAPICWQKVCLRVEMDGEIYRRWGKFMFLSKHTCSCGEVTQRRCDPVNVLFKERFDGRWRRCDHVSVQRRVCDGWWIQMFLSRVNHNTYMFTLCRGNTHL